jgi:uncharacterized membrane protein YjgN (DUF898 family)
MEGHQSIATAAGGATVVSFEGRRGALVGIVLKNLFFNVLTGGIYRFWAKTRLRRYFWSGISIGGERLEYTGKGSELLIGFLIVIAILVPFTLVWQLTNDLSVGFSTPIRVTLNVAYYIALGFLIEVAIFRARRYRLSRTLWRAIRFNQTGSAMSYAGIAILQRLLSLVTLGFTEPWRTVVLQRRLFRATQFGAQSFAFDGHGFKLMRWYWPAWVSFWSTIAVTALVNMDDVAVAMKAISASEVSGGSAGNMPTPTLWPIAGFALAALLYARYQVRQYRFLANSISLGAAHAVSSIKTRRVLGYAFFFGLLNLAWVAVLFAIFFAAAKAEGDSAPVAVPLLIALFVLLWFTSPIIRMAWLLFPIIREFCRTLEIRNLQSVESVVQSHRAGPRFGEGLADAFDVGGL